MKWLRRLFWRAYGWAVVRLRRLLGRPSPEIGWYAIMGFDRKWDYETDWLDMEPKGGRLIKIERWER